MTYSVSSLNKQTKLLQMVLFDSFANVDKTVVVCSCYEKGLLCLLSVLPELCGIMPSLALVPWRHCICKGHLCQLLNLSLKALTQDKVWLSHFLYQPAGKTIVPHSGVGYWLWLSLPSYLLAKVCERISSSNREMHCRITISCKKDVDIFGVHAENVI